MSWSATRDVVWAAVVGLLWLFSQKTYWKLSHVQSSRDVEVARLQALVRDIQKHSRELIATQCNLTAISIATERHSTSPDATLLASCQTSLANARAALFDAKEAARLEANEKAMVPAVRSRAQRYSPSAVRKEDEWLLIGIPTVPRTHNEDHLLKVLDSILRQLPTDAAHPMYGKVKLLIMNTAHREHARFNEAKTKYLGGDHSVHVEFVDEPEDAQDPGGDRRENANRPGPKVRRQTRNIASVLRAAANRGRYFLFLEDDMLMCPNAIRAIVYLLDRATSYHSDWIAVRASFGMNGIFMQSSELNTFADYLIQHQSRRPPDHLVVEYYAGETPQSAKIKDGRAHFGFRYNLFDHLGVTSTLRSQKAKQMPVCYEQLTFPIVFPVESFKPKQCPFDDLWPCPAQPFEPRVGWGDGIKDPKSPKKPGKK